jgi:hypothetical protein
MKDADEEEDQNPLKRQRTFLKAEKKKEKTVKFGNKKQAKTE